jgi:hypothetical protein
MAMNERIKEFAKQAGFYKYGDDFEDIIEKFAELIVRECIDIANAGIDPAESHLPGDDILKHFGVEESPTNGETK